MSGRMPQYRSPTPRPHPGTQVSPRLFRQRRLWMQLTAYRPLAVLAGIWIALLAIALLAYGQLLQTVEDAETAAVPSAELYPHERLNASTEDTEPQTPNDEPAQPRVPEAEAPLVQGVASEHTEVTISAWTLVALVGGCALGCWLLSVVIKMPRTRKKTKKRSQKRRIAQASARRVAAKPSQSRPAVRRLDAYDPANPVVAPSSQRSAAPNPPASGSPAQTSSPAEVSVVSEEVQHRLDWPSDSLVNTADVRQRRSLSSFL